MDHMKEGDEPRFTTSALTAPTSRETSRTFAPSPLPSQGGHTLLRHRKSRFDPNSCAFFSHRTQFVWIFQSSKTVTGKGCLQYRLKVVEGKRYRF